ncbi:MAG: hypothetical protein IJ571_09295 [Ruminococcus sp.]|nr:hypothetical protein [Ruminococcus sp.]
MSLYLDIFTAAALILCVFAGYWRGIFKYAVLLLTSLLAVVVSLVFTQLTTENVYDRFVKGKISKGLESVCEAVDVEKTVNEKLAEMNVDITLDARSVNEAFDGTTRPSESIKGLLESRGLDTERAEEAAEDVFSQVKYEAKRRVSVDIDESVFNSAIKQAADDFDKQSAQIFFALSRDDPAYAAELLEENVVRGIALPIVRVLLFFVYLLLFELAARAIVLIVGVFSHMKLTVGLRLAGAALGAFKGALYVLMAAYLAAELITALGSVNNYISLSQCEDTLLFKYFFAVFY